jgi:hypothetical protein
VGELLLTVLMIALLWGGKFPRVGLCAVTGFTFWASYDTGRRVIEAPGGIDVTTVGALLVLVALGGIFPGLNVFAILESDRPPEAELSPKYALVTLVFLLAGLATGAFASTALGS